MSMKYYFDITDLVKFAQKNGSVSGIQRVQIRVLQHLSSEEKKMKFFALMLLIDSVE